MRALGSAPPVEGSEPAAAGASAPSDPVLLRGCRAGDEDCWNLLVSRYDRLVFSVGRRNGLTVEDAADVTQTTFEALLSALDVLRDDERLAPWLMTVARRQSWRVRNRHATEYPTAGVPEQVTDPVPEWDQALVVHDALSRLGEPCRTLLVLLYLDPDQPSYAEVARRLRRAIGGIGPLRARCLDRLRSLCGDGSDVP